MSAESADSVVYNDFKFALEELSVNSKPYINMLTMLAEESHDQAPAVVKAIEERLVQASSDMKIPILYVLDSIVKNLKESDYLTLFDSNIVKLFVQTFEQLDERNRQALHKLRMTWVDVFSNRKLYAIDVAINKLDSGWPIVASPEMLIHVNPNFVQLAVKDKSNIKNMKKDEESTNISNRDPRLVKSKDATSIISLKNKAISFLSNDNTKKRRKRSENSSSTLEESIAIKDSKDIKNSTISNDTQIFSGGDKDYRYRCSTLLKPWDEKEVPILLSNSIPIQQADQQSIRLPVHPLIQSISQTFICPPFQPSVQAVSSLQSQIELRMINPSISCQNQSDPRIPCNSTSNSICIVEVDGRTYEMKPNTRQLFQLYGIRYEFLCDTSAKCVFLNSKHCVRFGEPRRYVDLPGARSRRVSMQYLGQSLDMWIDGRHIEVRVDGPGTSIVINGRQHVIRMDSISKEFTVDNIVRAVNVEDTPFQIYLSENDRQFNRLHEVRFTPSPKMIVVDGVQYLMRYDLPIPCAQTPDGQFYAIRFNGPPREIFIDTIPHVIPFDRPGRVKFERRAHEIAWGGPGFEVIVDGKPYEIQFNQPGQNIAFGQRTHHVRIQGPVPEVKLMDRLPFTESFIPKSTSNDSVHNSNCVQPVINNETTIISSTQQTHERWPQLEVNQLYDNLLRHGIIYNRPVSTQNKIIKSHNSIEDVRMDEDRNSFNASQSIRDVKFNGLKCFESSAVDSLYSGNQCPQCGLRFAVHLKNQYQTHLDWHFRGNRKEKDVALGGQTMHRDWYYSLDVWLKIEEIRDESDIVLPNEEVNSIQSVPKSNSFSCPAAQDDHENICRVCFEPFDQFYHGEREEWHLKEALRVGDWVYHVTCLQDAAGADIDPTNSDLIVTDIIEELVQTISKTNV